ncbi:MAG: leader peptide processing enzyme [Spirochaetota bacterium]
MNKKANTIVFMLVATLFNVIITVACFVLLLLLYGRLLAPLLPQETAAIGLPIVFIAAIVLSFVIYRYALKLFTKRFEAEKYFDPLIKSRRPPKRD